MFGIILERKKLSVTVFQKRNTVSGPLIPLLQQPSSNYDDSGFFSVQVIDNALRVWGLELLQYNSQNEIARRARDDPT